MSLSDRESRRDLPKREPEEIRLGPQRTPAAHDESAPTNRSSLPELEGRLRLAGDESSPADEGAAES
ncbi:MAG: hypothetical protein ACRDLK_02115 [Gaiellaceae bacterium]